MEGLTSSFIEGIAILDELWRNLNSQFTNKKKIHWCVDANCAWRPQDCIDFLRKIEGKPYAKILYMVEQVRENRLLIRSPVVCMNCRMIVLRFVIGAMRIHFHLNVTWVPFSSHGLFKSCCKAKKYYKSGSVRKTSTPAVVSSYLRTRPCVHKKTWKDLRYPIGNNVFESYCSLSVVPIRQRILDVR